MSARLDFVVRKLYTVFVRVIINYYKLRGAESACLRPHAYGEILILG